MWYCVRRRQLGAAFLLAAGYDAFLRTGEMLSLTIADVSIDADDRGIIKLVHTKTGQRHAAFEVATVNDPLVGQLFRQYRRALPAGTHEEHYIFAGSAKSFCQLFDDGLKWLSLQSYKFKPYSIRRGGATAFYRRTRQMEFTLERGRWSSYRVARIYINDGLAKEVEMQFPPHLRFVLATKASALTWWLASQ